MYLRWFVKKKPYFQMFTTVRYKQKDQFMLTLVPPPENLSTKRNKKVTTLPLVVMYTGLFFESVFCKVFKN